MCLYTLKTKQSKVEGHGKVELEHNSELFPLVAALDELRGVDEVFRDGASADEASLVDVDKIEDMALEASGHELGQDLHRAVLEGDWPESIGRLGSILLRDHDDEGSVEPFQVGSTGVDSLEEAVDVVADRGPGGVVEAAPKAIGTRGAVNVHLRAGGLGVVNGEGRHECCNVSARLVDVEAVDVEVPGCRRFTARMLV